MGHADKVKGPTQTNTRVDVEPHGVSEDGETPRAEDAAKTIDEEETLGPVEDEVQGIQNTEGNASEEGDAEGEGGNATDEGGDEVQNTLNNSAGTDELLTAEAAISAVLEEAEKAAHRGLGLGLGLSKLGPLLAPARIVLDIILSEG